MKANLLRNGQALRIDGKLYIATSVMHRTPGNLRAFVQVKLKDVASGVGIEKRFSSTEDVDSVNLDRRDVEYLYKEGGASGGASGTAVFMDNETYDQFNIDADVLGDALLYIRPNETIKGLFHDGRCLSVELPLTVEHTIAETEPGVKNATATNVLKEAVTETGLKVRVPPFISIGERVRISTETTEYLSRA